LFTGQKGGEPRGPELRVGEARCKLKETPQGGGGRRTVASEKGVRLGFVHQRRLTVAQRKKRIWKRVAELPGYECPN